MSSGMLRRDISGLFIIIVIFVFCTRLYPVYVCHVFSVNKGFQCGSVAITNIWFLLVCSVYCSVLKDLCFTCVTFFFIFCVFISPYISEPANGQFLGMVRNSWGYGVILVSHDWILHFVPLFSGSCGNCPKFCQKFDSALIWRVVVPKWLNI